jgi:GNAT superfamily N-acetyltransferase
MPPPVTVRPVTSRADRARFLDLPYRHYAGDAAFVPPLRMDQANVTSPRKNPFFDHGRMQLFLAERDGQAVGRVAAIVNGMHLEKYADGAGFFGFFESPDDDAVAGALVEAAAGWLRAEGMTSVRGPANPTMNDVAGLLVEGFDRPPSVLMAYNKPYYERLLAAQGFTRAMTMWAYYVHEAYLKQDRLRRGAELVLRRNPGLRVRPLDRARFWEDVDAAMAIYNEAWKENWGHVPYTRKEAAHLAKELKPVLDHRLFHFLELDGNPVAFSVTLPNFNRVLKHLPDGRLLPAGLPKLLAYQKFGAIYEVRRALMGILPEYRSRGFDAVLIDETVSVGRRLGYQACEMSWVLDVNAKLVNSLEHLGAVRDKEYAMFEKAL